MTKLSLLVYVQVLVCNRKCPPIDIYGKKTTLSQRLLLLRSDKPASLVKLYTIKLYFLVYLY